MTMYSKNNTKIKKVPSAGMADLFAHQHQDFFASSCWPERAVFVHGPLQRLMAITEAPELRSTEAMFKFLQTRVHEKVRLSAWLENPLGGLQGQIPVDPWAAEALFKAGGVTIVVSGIHWISNAVYDLLYGIDADLGVVSRPFTCNAYISPPGRGAGIHFDEQDNFALQVFGKKEWRFTPNGVVRYPRGVVRSGIKWGDAAKFGCSFIEQMPESADKEILQAGSVFFAPRGTWHETLAIENSLSLTFSFGTPSWLDIVNDVLRDWMLMREGWREPVFGLKRDNAADRIADHFSGLNGQLRIAIDSPEFQKAVRDRIFQEDAYYWKNLNCRIELGQQSDSNLTVIVHLKNSLTEKFEIQVALFEFPFVQWLLSDEAYFSDKEIQKFANGNAAEFKQNLSKWLELGVLQKRRQPPLGAAK